MVQTHARENIDIGHENDLELSPEYDGSLVLLDHLHSEQEGEGEGDEDEDDRGHGQEVGTQPWALLARPAVQILRFLATSFGVETILTGVDSRHWSQRLTDDWSETKV